MSFNLRAIREIHDDETSNLLSHLAKKASDFANAQNTQELENKEDIYSNGQDVDAVVKLHSDLTSTNIFAFDKEYYIPKEPDGDTVKLWLKGSNMGSTLKDWSGFNNVNSINGDPLIIDGTPFDYGINDAGVKSVCLRLNRPTSQYENQEYIRIADSAGIKMLVSSSSISIFIRFKVKSIVNQGGLSRTLFCKLDDDVPDYAQMLHITDAGRLRWIIKRGGSVVAAKETPTSTIAVDTVYEVWLTYAVSGNAVKIYVNNVDQTLTDYVGSVNWPTTTTDHDMSLFRRGEGSDGGFVYGDLYDYMFVRNYTVSATDVSRHYTNKWSITNIPFGQVQVTNHYAIPWTEEVSYESDSYEADSFEV